jgi:hypothetical protein
MENTFLNNVTSLEHTKALLIIIQHPETICYLEADDLSVHLVQENGARFYLGLLLNDLEDVLPKKDFFRCGWSFTVNANMVKEFWISAEPMLVMACGHIIPVPMSEIHRVINCLERRKKGSRKPAICY